jgi:hypothetical protein
MKKALLFTLFLVITSFGAFAQSASNGANVSTQGPDPETDMRAMDAVKKLDGIVTLTEEQNTKALQIYKSYFYELRGLGAKADGTKSATSRDKKLKEVLTADQWKLMTEAKAKGKGE